MNELVAMQCNWSESVKFGIGLFIGLILGLITGYHTFDKIKQKLEKKE